MPEIDHLFEKMIVDGASDLHIKQGQPPCFRINGRLKPIEGQSPLTDQDMLGFMKPLVPDHEWGTFENVGDLDFAYALPDGERFRANFFRQIYGLGAIFRRIPSKILTLDDLKMPDVLRSFSTLRSGLVVVTGPTGSGKSTTLAAVIDDINSNEKRKIITIEEPVEFMHISKQSYIIHRQVGLDTQSFATGLRGAIKSDVNVILVGEMRDAETIALALQAAEMGILVFGTLHTSSAAKTIDRIIDVFPASRKNQVRSVLSNTLRGVVAQQLIRSVDGQSRHCAYEILLKTPALGSLIRNGDTSKIISEIQLSSNEGMILMDDCLARLVKEKKVSNEEAYKKAFDKDNFRNLVG